MSLVAMTLRSDGFDNFRCDRYILKRVHRLRGALRDLCGRVMCYFEEGCGLL